MRTLPLHHGTIHVASLAGESRRITVSGLAKARLLWLFRNYSILEFPVLSKKQQQLIWDVWDAQPQHVNNGRAGGTGTGVASREVRRDLIGTIEAFRPPPASTAWTVGEAGQRRTPAHPRPESPERPSLLFELRAALRGAAAWRAATMLLLGATMYLGPRYLPPKTQVSAVAAEKARSEAKPSAPASAEPVAAEPAQGSAAPVAELVDSPPVAPVRLPISTLGSEAPSSVGTNLPVAMARPDLTLPAAALQLRSESSPKPQGKREVLIRVSVDASGRPHSFQFVNGDQTKRPAALRAARLWNFQPCAARAGCEQVLKFTDYGDSSRVQRVQ